MLIGRFFLALRLAAGRPLPEGGATQGIGVWLPAVGLALGVLIAVTVRIAMSIDVWFAALAGLVAWVGLSGARPLAGLATICRAPGDDGAPGAPPVGSIVVTLAMIAMLILLMLLSLHGGWWSLALLLAWARFAPLMWVTSLPPAATENAEPALAAWVVDPAQPTRWAVVLFIASLVVNWALLAAPIAIVGWRLWMKRRPVTGAPGGLTVERLFAGIVLVELASLACVVVRLMMADYGA
ncbi:hypothetical protein [Parapedomonas caeni]